MPTLLAPSVLAADFANLQRDIEMINASDADWFHLDIMDGVFVPNISFGMPVIKSIAQHAKKPLDVHLMIIEPDRYIETFANLGTDNLTVHYEACTHLHRTLQAIKATGMTAGVAINPHTSISLLEDVIKDIDVVCVMSVNPGFGGQSFIENTYKKVTALKALIKANNATAKSSFSVSVIAGKDTRSYPKIHFLPSRSRPLGSKPLPNSLPLMLTLGIRCFFTSKQGLSRNTI